MKNRRYINSYASTAAIINLQNQIDDIKAGGSGGSGEGGDTSALEARVTTIENSLKNYATADALDTAIAGVEGQVDGVEAIVSDKLGVDDVAVWAKSEDPTLIPVNKLAAEASAREKAIETATSDLVHNTRLIAGKSLESDVVLYAADIKEKDNSADTVYDLMPKIISCPIDARVIKDSYTVAEIFNMFGGATTMTEVRVFADRGVNYLRMANSIDSYQNYMIPVNYYQIPNGTGTTGTIKLIGIGPDPDNGDLITKFTITMTLNGDASTIAIDTKALEA